MTFQAFNSTFLAGNVNYTSCVGEGSRDLKEPLINNVKSNQNVVNNVIISTDRLIDRQILLDNVSADNMKMFSPFS